MKKSTILILLVAFFVQFMIYSQENKTPDVNLHMAVLQGNIDAVRQHIKAGTDLNKKDQFGSTPLIIAATFGKTEIAKALIEAGADMNIGNKEKSTPLHIAALFCRPEIIQALLDKGANRYIRNISGSTAFDIVAAPFEYDKETYDEIGAGLKPLGLVLDYKKIDIIFKAQT